MQPEQDQTITVVRQSERRPGPMTPGMDRQEAVATDDLWAGWVRTEVGMMSGWHHHGEYDSVIYVMTGSLRMEFGAKGSQVVDANPGDFLLVPKGVVHRESNPSGEPADVIVVRSGQGESLFNLDGPMD
jgi:uncharacterized RmlC-like cupin family protein